MDNKIQGLIVIDRKEMSDEEYSEFKQFTSQFFIDFHRLNTMDNRELYSCICRNKELLFDSEDEEGNVTIGALTIMGERNPELLGLWYKNGLLVGTEKVQITQEVVDDNGNVTIGEYEIQGTPDYPFNSEEYIKFMPDIVEYDEEGVELSRTRPTEAKQMHCYSGYSKLTF